MESQTYDRWRARQEQDWNDEYQSGRREFYIRLIKYLDSMYYETSILNEEYTELKNNLTKELYNQKGLWYETLDAFKSGFKSFSKECTVVVNEAIQKPLISKLTGLSILKKIDEIEDQVETIKQ